MNELWLDFWTLNAPEEFVALGKGKVRWGRDLADLAPVWGQQLCPGNCTSGEGSVLRGCVW